MSERTRLVSAETGVAYLLQFRLLHALILLRLLRLPVQRLRGELRERGHNAGWSEGHWGRASGERSDLELEQCLWEPSGSFSCKTKTLNLLSRLLIMVVSGEGERQGAMGHCADPSRTRRLRAIRTAVRSVPRWKYRRPMYVKQIIFGACGVRRLFATTFTTIAF